MIDQYAFASTFFFLATLTLILGAGQVRPFFDALQAETRPHRKPQQTELNNPEITFRKVNPDG